MSIIPGEKAARSTVVMDDGYVATPLAHGGGESAVIVVQPRGVVNTYVDLPTVAADGSTPDSYLEIVSDNSEEAQGRLRIVLTSEMELTTLNRDEILYNCRVELTGTDLNTDTVALIDGESVLVSELEYPSNGFSLLSSDPLKTITEMEYTGDAKVTYVDSTNENDNIAERIITIDNPRSDVVILVTFDTPAP